MNQKQKLFSFMCNPAAHLHEEWRDHLVFWGVPENICARLWARRNDSGELSYFLAERFHLHFATPFEFDESLRPLILAENADFEEALIRLGLSFLYKPALKILDGSALRAIKEDIGFDNFDYLRYRAPNLIAPDMLGEDFESDFESGDFCCDISKERALLFGLAHLVNILPDREDIITRLCFKLSPFSKTPTPPKDFDLIYQKVSQAQKISTKMVKRIFEMKKEGV